jgi:hypothetical protein
MSEANYSIGPSPNPTTRASSATKTDEMTWAEEWAYRFFVIVGLFLMLSGWVGYLGSSTPSRRFAEDNAYGASANALERLVELEKQSADGIAGTGRAICGILFWVLASLIKLRVAVRVASQVPSVPPHN